jgi:hypothetical protein
MWQGRSYLSQKMETFISTDVTTSNPVSCIFIVEEALFHPQDADNMFLLHLYGRGGTLPPPGWK